MNGYLYAWTNQSLEQLESRVRKTEGRWAYVESETDVRLIERSALNDPVDYLHGRIFDEAGELRWQQTGSDRFLIQQLTEQGNMAGDPTVFTTLDETIALVGTHISALEHPHYLYTPDSQAAIWIETRIPRPLMYPVEQTTTHVQVKARHYLLNGTILLTRWLRLEGADARP